jgi:hypothetical protein
MVIEATVCSGLAEKSVVKRSCDQREVEATITIATDSADSAVVVMCWDNGGKGLVGLNGDSSERRLRVLRRVTGRVTRASEGAGSAVCRGSRGAIDGDCEFEKDRVISREFLQRGYQPAEAGMMRHIPAELIASSPDGVPTWQAAGFIVDVGPL